MVARSKYDERIKDRDIVVFTFITSDFDRGLRNSNTAHFILRDPPTFFQQYGKFQIYWRLLLSRKRGLEKILDKKNTKIRKYERDLNRAFALDSLIAEVNRLRISNQKFLLVHSPSQEELKNTHVVERTKVLSKLKNLFPNNFISLASDFRDAYRNDPSGLYKKR